ncbi:MAG: peroxiredoxin [Methylococcales bacterium]|nr:peroxiredoxin [Methylococcales bacterium]
MQKIRFSSAIKKGVVMLSLFTLMGLAHAEKVSVGQQAPLFTLHAQDGSTLDLASRQGKGWTVLYFYPKAGTPGCTTQACAFRDAIKVIRSENADVFGISTDDVENLQKFHKEHQLTFTLLSDPDAKVTEAYGVKMPIVTVAKRWTFILDPSLVIRQIDDDVDPAMDAMRVAKELQKLQAK